ncbi:MAG: MBL fold metallo-hydrolase [Salinimicrobium sediminis]|uniref:L-ascorbate metabolism protein UlaG, beta-lactamase superfamily n=1 Tax=Salinimicrobium sediminis TaxID=1343891 RepID=A0A285X2U5_9FLAO|nr:MULTISPECIES: MBL fold metallo-hydrolase [Salinimicrobium]MDX1601454.1 MBL fold metallo-hydrolase [Salinimicrobium sediminis]SOC79346.1 L-ascorbate metabolism protein UlaG, beta-lactamase superfamily [Salinimicrobium sediminis]
MKKALKLFSRVMIALLSIVVVLALIVGLYMQHPKFGATPTGKRLEMIKKSPNYKDGSFKNRSYTPSLTEGHSMGKVMFDFLFRKSSKSTPKSTIPSVQTNLKNLPNGDWLVWFGHSSYFIQTDGIKILVDPVFSANASPIPGSTKAFKGTNVYTAEDLPEIDYLFISHDHYDHLDYETMKKLKGRVKYVICGLGVGAHLEKWGYEPEKIMEMDWDTKLEPQKGIQIYGLTARHFSGRGFKRDASLWMSYLLETPTHKIFIGGDGGYDKHFEEIGKLHGPIDLAILENGQYNEAWQEIHFLPGENLQAALDLKAQRLMPVHSSKFDLALHDWDEPLNEMSRLNQSIGIPLVTPVIGELVNLNDSNQKFTEWWKELK